MAREILKDTKLKNAKPAPKEYLLADGDGLYCRVREDGAKGWLFIYSLHGKRRKKGMGSYPAVTLQAARERAQAYRGAVAKGIDPQTLVREQRAEAHRRAGRLTVTGLFELWHKREASTRKDEGVEARRLFDKDIKPRIGARFADEVRRSDVRVILDDVADRGVKVMPRYVLADLRQMFKFGVERDHVLHDPTAGIDKKKVGQAAEERERVLSTAEIFDLSRKVLKTQLPEYAQHAIWLALSTLLRVGEIRLARWTDVDLEAGTWRIPPEHSKNEREHLVHLSEFTSKHLRALQELDLSDVYLIPGLTEPGEEEAPLAKSTLGRMLYERQSPSEKIVKTRKYKADLVGTLSLDGGIWGFHDLRRTGATMLGELGVRSDVIDRLLNHKEQRKVTRIYQRQELMGEREDAMRLLGERIDLILRGDGKVVAGKFGKAAQAA